MHPHEHPLCQWSGISPDDPERVIECGKGAIGFAPSANGRRVFACEEHIGWAKETAETGEFVFSTRSPDSQPPITSHAASQLDRHNAAVAGHTDLEPD